MFPIEGYMPPARLKRRATIQLQQLIPARVRILGAWTYTVQTQADGARVLVARAPAIQDTDREAAQEAAERFADSLRGRLPGLVADAQARIAAEFHPDGSAAGPDPSADGEARGEGIGERLDEVEFLRRSGVSLTDAAARCGWPSAAAYHRARQRHHRATAEQRAAS